MGHPGPRTLARLSEPRVWHPSADTAYCAALEYALPPTVGLGIGVDRLCMLVSGTSHLRDVLAFPVHRGQQRSE
eukprot:m.474001 g.474001  ORF g.474001 m.474001 type:complete len:74 (+) comp21670_c3_seq13:188-409(+)